MEEYIKYGMIKLLEKVLKEILTGEIVYYKKEYKIWPFSYFDWKA